jgi:hypothetical protein
VVQPHTSTRAALGRPSIILPAGKTLEVGWLLTARSGAQQTSRSQLKSRNAARASSQGGTPRAKPSVASISEDAVGNHFERGSVISLVVDLEQNLKIGKASVPA